MHCFRCARHSRPVLRNARVFTPPEHGSKRHRTTAADRCKHDMCVGMTCHPYGVYLHHLLGAGARVDVNACVVFATVGGDTLRRMSHLLRRIGSYPKKCH